MPITGSFSYIYCLIYIKQIFLGLQLLNCTAHEWIVARKEHEILLQPVEKRVTLELRKELSLNTNIKQVY